MSEFIVSAASLFQAWVQEGALCRYPPGLTTSLVYESPSRKCVRVFWGGGITGTAGEDEGKKEREGSARVRQPRCQGSGLMKNTLLQAQYPHMNLITPFLGVAAFC